MLSALKFILASALLLLSTSYSWALANDSQQPINIQSDSAVQQSLSNGERITYTGNVIMTQGSMLIKADSITIISRNKEVSEMTAKGKPAHFEQQSSPEQQAMSAHANKIKYQLKSGTALFIGDASIEQEGSIVSGERIVYNINKEQIQASSAKNESSRVHMVLNPKQATETDKPETNTDDKPETSIPKNSKETHGNSDRN
jgi:lipopolysaccharide export system protein LptA